MAPLVLSYGEWLINRELITSIQMLAAMDSESTDGESSLLSNSGIETSLSLGLKVLTTQNPFRSNIYNESSSANSLASNCSSSQAAVQNSLTVKTSLHGSMVSDHEGSTNCSKPTTGSVQGTASFDDGLTGSFYFESDHLAFKGNSDYRLMLRTVALLESQRMKAIQDLDRLIQCKVTALSNPIEFVGKLQQRVDLDIPPRQNVCEVPSVDWEYYTSAGAAAQFKQPRHITRHTKQHGDTMVSRGT